jgi:type VI secretion system protein VasG
MAINQQKSLLSKLNPVCQQALLRGKNLSAARRNSYIELAHWLMGLLEQPDSDLSRIFTQYGVQAARAQKELTAALDKMRRGGGEVQAWSTDIWDAIRDAWVVATLHMNAYKVRTGYLLAALLTTPGMSEKVLEASPELGKIPADKVIEEMRGVITGSGEDQYEATAMPIGPATEGDGRTPIAGSKTPNLDQFTTNLTQRAKEGHIDPVVGRDFEIRQCVDILTRRRQNNPILTGEAGVGKTAVVEGFALRIVAGDVPPSLKNVELRVLDIGLLQAGASVKGEFENRLKGVIAEVKASPTPIVLFIDEAHTVVGAGGGGAGDAANLLKPALARGELRTIAATTWMEYKKYFEEDPALKRRFQMVKVDEPDVKKATDMMRKVTGTLEKHHKVRILDEAVEDSVKLSHRYITDRQLPDKSVSLLDTACARVGLSLAATPGPLEETTREIEYTDTEIGILEREAASGAGHGEKLADLKEKKTALEARKARLAQQWEDEKKLVGRIQELRGKTEEAAKKGAPDLAAVEELNRVNKELEKLQGETPLVYPVVTRQTIADVVSGWTGIPVGKMVTDEISTVLKLQDRLRERVVGQDYALSVIAERMRTSKAQLLDPRRPIGVFMLVGPSGVGKTETAMALSDILYGGTKNLVVVNMSEYKEEHKISRLTGSAPGYVGFGQGGVLTEAVRRKPYSIVLLDEVEKAHQSVQEIFYQVFDKGTLQDDRGAEVDFKNTIIILTSNVGTDSIMKMCADPEAAPDPVVLAEKLKGDLLKAFKPALLGRMAVVPFYPLSDKVIRLIITMNMKRIKDRLWTNHKVKFDYDPAAEDLIAGRCKDPDSGARNVETIVTGTVLPEMAEKFLQRMAEDKKTESVRLSVKDGKFEYLFFPENG